MKRNDVRLAALLFSVGFNYLVTAVCIAVLFSGVIIIFIGSPIIGLLGCIMAAWVLTDTDFINKDSINEIKELLLERKALSKQ